MRRVINAKGRAQVDACAVGRAHDVEDDEGAAFGVDAEFKVCAGDLGEGSRGELVKGVNTLSLPGIVCRKLRRHRIAWELVAWVSQDSWTVFVVDLKALIWSAHLCGLCSHAEVVESVRD